MAELIHRHDNICSVIHKKRHLKSDIKCHLTLNIIFSAGLVNGTTQFVGSWWH